MEINQASVDEQQEEPTEILLKKMKEIKSQTEDSIQLLTFQEISIKIIKCDFNKGIFNHTLTELSLLY